MIGNSGIYEQLITKLVASKLDDLDRDTYFIKDHPLDKSEAARVLAMHLVQVIQQGLELITGENSIERQIDVTNHIVTLLREYFHDPEFDEDLVENQAKMLSAIFKRVDSGIPDFDRYLKEITPYTRLSQSELFTGSNAGVSLESELRKEILSSDRLCFLVSFIRYSGIIIFKDELTEFTRNGGSLRIITTTYMGATDFKAIQFLSGLPNTQIKVSYNTSNERLHAKAYLFLRNTGFNTGYIGSSNISHSALTRGLEWNMKVTSREVGHIIDKFEKTFETYWQDNEFELYVPALHAHKLRTALRTEQTGEGAQNSFFDIAPYPFQQEILEKLETERTVHLRVRNLIVAATGTGKTVISAFDFKKFRAAHPDARFLYVAHRKEILQQALSTFRGILRDNNFGELWVDGLEPDSYAHLFASVQTLNSRMDSVDLSATYYDYIIVDEVHHIAATSYRPILERFTPKILLGLTATPERMDGADILKDFSGAIAAEIRLPEALNRRLLCPFQYFGITDSVDLSQVQWQNGRYLPGELTQLYTQNDRRVLEIIDNLEKYVTDVNNVRALCFCVTQTHAEYMAEKFTLAGLKADYLVSARSDLREELRRKLIAKEINYLFVVDIFNEGVDIREIDTVLFLRPTESLTVFLQQLGRGLRLTEGKEILTVLDFVGNARPEYDFEGKFRALVGRTNTPTHKEIEANFPHLPLGCSIILEKKAKQTILDNIHAATQFNITKLLEKIRNFQHQSTLPLTLKNFCRHAHIPIEFLYSKKALWKRLLVRAEQIDDFSTENEKEIYRTIANKWLSCQSTSYFEFILGLAQREFAVECASLSEEQQLMCMMLHHDVWQSDAGFASLDESIRAIGRNPVVCEEIIEVMELLLDRIDFIERPIELPYAQPLKLHARYTREQILSAFRFNTFEKRASNREGVAENKELNTELLFIDLIKAETDYSPTTLYNDYAISDTEFHWQSQNATRPDRGKGLTYIRHRELGKKILLFVREKKENEFGTTIAYVFLGDGELIDHYGSKPMSIRWKLTHPMPPYLWKDSAKMAVG